MKSLFVMSLIFTAGLSAFAKKHCTDEPKEKWMSEADFKKKVEAEGIKSVNSSNQELAMRFMEQIKTVKKSKSILIQSTAASSKLINL